MEFEPVVAILKRKSRELLRLTLIFHRSIQSIGMCACCTLICVCVLAVLSLSFSLRYRYLTSWPANLNLNNLLCMFIWARERAYSFACPLTTSFSFKSRVPDSFCIYRWQTHGIWFLCIYYENCYDFILNRCDLSFGSRNAIWFIRWMTRALNSCSNSTKLAPSNVVMLDKFSRCALEENSKNKHWFRHIFFPFIFSLSFSQIEILQADFVV